jgi:hypothetical protein
LVPIDDPAAQHAAATNSAATGRHHTADIVATLILLVVHGCLFGATFALLGLLVMTTDPCGSVKCGDPAWIDYAMTLGIWGGAALLLIDIVIAGYLLVRQQRAFFVPILGCVAQVALAIGAVSMELQAGPV